MEECIDDRQSWAPFISVEDVKTEFATAADAVRPWPLPRLTFHTCSSSVSVRTYWWSRSNLQISLARARCFTNKLSADDLTRNSNVPQLKKSSRSKWRIWASRGRTSCETSCMKVFESMTKCLNDRSRASRVRANHFAIHLKGYWFAKCRYRKQTLPFGLCVLHVLPMRAKI